MRVVADLDNQFPKQSAYVERAVLAEVMSVAGAYLGGSAAYLEERFPNDKVSRSLLTRATASMATSANSAVLVEAALGEFLKSLAPQSAAAEIMKRGVKVPLGRQGVVHYPVRADPPAAAPWVAEGDPIPVVTRTFDGTVIGPHKKVALISAVTGELARRNGGAELVSQVLREDVSLGLDAAYFSATPASDAANAGLLYGLTPLSGTPGADAIAMAADLEALAAAVSANGSGQVVFIVSPANAARLPIRVPEIAGRITVLPSQGLANTRIIAVDPVSILHSMDPAPDIVVSKDAVLHMNDDPAEVVDGSGEAAAPVRSFFQTDGVAIRIIVDLAFTPRRADAVAFIDNASW
ncbi:phage major capsid protein [Pseudoxanthobacter sp. M-2]|uniref:phage major capsid family protein n=1 Tax=Pseudoxanthobacter sp. M-2 TaxID=3078754 RepID=UPI0038FC96FC